MIALESTRAALQSAKPIDRTDELIKSELNAGRSVEDVFNDLRPIVDAVFELPGLTEDGEKAFLGSLDALTGNCRKERCYTDTPRISASSR